MEKYKLLILKDEMLEYLKSYGYRDSTVNAYIHMLPQRLLDSTGIDWESIEKIGRRSDIWVK